MDLTLKGGPTLSLDLKVDPEAEDAAPTAARDGESRSRIPGTCSHSHPHRDLVRQSMTGSLALDRASDTTGVRPDSMSLGRQPTKPHPSRWP